MKIHRVGLLAFTLTSVMALASANAADMYSPGGYKDAPYLPASWAGLYVGANGGGGWSADTPVVSVTNNFGGSATTGKSLDAEGGFGGVQIGYNWQRGAFVFGVEGDLEISNIKDDFKGLFGANFFDARKELDYFSTIRGRLGYSFGNVLVYGTGGFAYGAVHNRVFVNGVADAHKDTTETGFAAGGGVEYALTPQLSLKAEYQFIDLGSYKMSAPVVPPNGVVITTSTIENNFNTVRFGVNYRLTPAYEPLK
jgi:outer membrane immunogenic protein